MMLVVSLAADNPSLHGYEFVHPVVRSVRGAGLGAVTVHHANLEPEMAAEADGLILCGTALTDNGALDRIDSFGWLADLRIPVLGICLGANVVCAVHGGGHREDVEIGHVRLLVSETEDPLTAGMDGREVYALHTLAPVLPPALVPLASSGEPPAGRVQVFRREDSPVYGILFHPEVRHGNLIGRFCGLAPR